MDLNKQCPKMRPYQEEDLPHLFSQPRFGYFSDPGTGKTCPAAVYTFAKVHAGGRVIWVQPKSLIGKNVEEIIRFTPLEAREVKAVEGTAKQRSKVVEDRAVKVFVMTAEGLKAFGDRLLELHLDDFCKGAVVIDEFHMLYSTHSSQRTKALFKMMRSIRDLLVMTGTPIDGRLDSIYPFIKLVNPNYYPSHDHFLAQHAILDDFGGVMMWKNPEKVKEILGRHSIRRSFEEVYGPESKVVQIEKVSMSEKQRELYDEFDRYAMLELENAFLEGATPGVHTIRCRQIMEHPEDIPDPLDPERRISLLKKAELSGKDERILAHLQSNPCPTLIFACLVPQQRRLKDLIEKHLKCKVGLINGSVSAAERERIAKDFVEGRIDHVVASPATVAVGYNFPHVDHVLFASLDYSDTSFLQGYRRAMRGVREKRLLITILEYQDSIDQRMMEIINEKSRLANKVDPTREVFKRSNANCLV